MNVQRRGMRSSAVAAFATLGLALLALGAPFASPRLRPATAMAESPLAAAAVNTESLAGTGAGEEETAPVTLSVPEPAPPVPADVPVTVPVAVPVDVPVDVPVAVPVDACTEALQWVHAAGLTLPAGVGYKCPSARFAHHGAACWNASPCPGRTGFIAINTGLIGNAGTAYLHHVVAHEICHIVDFQAKGTSTEASADACAAAHGAPARSGRAGG